MYKKKMMLLFILFTVLLSFTFSVNAEDCYGDDCNKIHGDASNYGYDGSQPNVNDCPDCAWNTWGDTGTTLTITTKNGTTVSIDIYDGDSRYPCIGCYEIPGFPSAIDSDFNTNTDYNDDINEWLMGATVDGHLNSDHVVVGAIMQALEKENLCGENDILCAEQYILNNDEQEENDGLAITVDPYLIIKEKGADNYAKDYGNDDVTYKGINGAGIITNMCAAIATGAAVPELGYSANTLCVGNYDMDGTLCPTDDDPPQKEEDPPSTEPPSTEPPSNPNGKPGTPNYLVPKEIPTYEAKPVYTPPMVCGEKYNTSYSKYNGVVGGSCGHEYYIYTYDISIAAVENNKKVFAGKSFLWGDTNGNVNLHVTTTPGSVLAAHTYNAGVAVTNLELAKEYAEATLSWYESESAKAKNAASSARSSASSYNCDGLEAAAHNACFSTKSSFERLASEYEKKYNEIEAEKGTFVSQVYNPTINAYNQDYPKAKAQLDKYTACSESYQSMIGYSRFSNLGDLVETSNEKMILLGEVQEKGTMVGYSKHEGDLIARTEIESSSVRNNSLLVSSPEASFLVPMNVASGTKGTLTETVSVSEPSLSFNLKCNMEVVSSPYTCFDPPCGVNEKLGLNVIFRPISLINPFPDSGSNNSRIKMGKWSYDSVVEKIIIKNRGVADYSIYNLTPMYTFVLTSADIKDIRNYNKKHSYGDYNLRCTNGLYCQSNFLWGYDNEVDNFSYLIDMNNSCAMSTNWYNCNSDAGNYAEGFYHYLK